MPLLHPGDTFPSLDVTLVGGDALRLPDAFADRYGVVLLNRGSWCPFCTAQLRSFQRALPDLEELGAGVVSLSVDNEEDAQALVDKHHLTFPIGHNASAEQVSDLTGAFVNPDAQFLQATGFVLDREGKVLLSAYSSGAIGRITAEDTVGMLRHVLAKA